MKKWASVFLTACVLVTPSVMAEPLNYNVVNLSERVSQKLERDTMEVRLIVQEEGSDQEKLATAVTEKINKLIQKIKKNGRFEAGFTDRRSYQTGRQNAKDAKKTDYFWQEQATVSVRSKDFIALSNFIANVQNLARMDGVSFSTSLEKVKSVEEHLTEEALLLFKKRALFIVKTMGGTGYKVVNLNVGSTGGATSANMALGEVPLMLKANVPAPAQEIMAGSEELVLSVEGSIQVTGMK